MREGGLLCLLTSHLAATTLPASAVGAGLVALLVSEVWPEDEQLLVVVPVVCENSEMLKPRRKSSSETHASQGGVGEKWGPRMVLI